MKNKLRNIRAPLALSLALTAGAASAQTAAAIDTSSVVATIGTGLVAVAAIGAAWIGFRYLKKVWAKL